MADPMRCDSCGGVIDINGDCPLLPLNHPTTPALADTPAT